jgi:hypothetical protein
MSRYTMIRVTQYMSVYLSMKFSDKAWYTSILVCTEYMPVYTFTADFLSLLRGHILVHTRTSEHIRCATDFFLPAPGRPSCTLLLACLHPAGAQPFEKSSAFVAATRHTWSRTNKFIFMLAATGLAKSSLLVGSSRAIGSTGSARKRLRA